MQRRNVFLTSKLLGQEPLRQVAGSDEPTATLRPPAEPQLVTHKLPSLPPLAEPGQYVRTDAPDLMPARFTMVLRSGRVLSYPYAFVSLVDCASPETIDLHCTCPVVERILISGRSLGELAECLTAQRLVSMAEADNPQYAPEGFAVLKIEIVTKHHD